MRDLPLPRRRGPRSKNQIGPGLLRVAIKPGPVVVSDPDFAFDGLGPNYRLRRKDFPFRQLADPLDRESSILSDSNNVVSSQGVHHAIFGQEDRPGPDPDGFPVGQDRRKANVRRVEPRNTPTMINAVFNHRNFWGLRAQNLRREPVRQSRSSTAPTILRTPGRQPCPSICLVIPQIMSDSR
ncbi:MAG: cytochrome-c peroxidase [Acidobacteria bacterium]|nr:cytochrome-c peroxidase [Acidobacteriota bacterium]